MKALILNICILLSFFIGKIENTCAFSYSASPPIEKVNPLGDYEISKKKKIQHQTRKRLLKKENSNFFIIEIFVMILGSILFLVGAIALIVNIFTKLFWLTIVGWSFLGLGLILYFIGFFILLGSFSGGFSC